MRRTVNTNPLHAPCFWSASMAYCEHVGEYLQTEGSSGPRKSWYARTMAIRTVRTVAPVSTQQAAHRISHLGAQIGKGDGIGRRRGPHDDVPSMFRWQYVVANDFAEPTLEPVAIHCRLPMARNNDANPRKTERGSARPDREVPGPYDFPLLLNTPDVCAATDALRPRKAQARFTRRRTWTEASR